MNLLALASRALLLIGTLLYLGLAALALRVYIREVELFSVVTLGIVIQVIAGLPMLAFLAARKMDPVLPYATWLVFMTVALAISGFLGVPSDSVTRANPSLSFAAEIEELRGAMWIREVADLKVALAEARDEDEREALQAKIEAAKNSVSSESHPEEYRQLEIINAKLARAKTHTSTRQLVVFDAERSSGTMLMAAFIILAGAWMLDREQRLAENSEVLGDYGPREDAELVDEAELGS